MSEVVLQVVALGLEGVVVFVLDFPAAPSCADELFDVLLAEHMSGNPGVVKGLFGLLIFDDQLRPIDPQGILVILQGDMVGPTGDIGQMLFPIPHLLSPLVEILVRIAVRNPVGQPGVRGGLADQNEVQSIVWRQD